MSNKPEVVAYLISNKHEHDPKQIGVRLFENHDPSCVNDSWNYDPLIRLSYHEAAIVELKADRDQQYDMKVKAREQRDAVASALAVARTRIAELENSIASALDVAEGSTQSHNMQVIGRILRAAQRAGRGE